MPESPCQRVRDIPQPMSSVLFLVPVPAEPVPVISLADAVPVPALGSAELPTVGSAGHNKGSCKPCAFFHSRSCESGMQCSFCHLCPADEKRRRQKDKQTRFRAMHQQRRQDTCRAGIPTWREFHQLHRGEYLQGGKSSPWDVMHVQDVQNSSPGGDK